MLYKAYPLTFGSAQTMFGKIFAITLFALYVWIGHLFAKPPAKIENTRNIVPRELFPPIVVQDIEPITSINEESITNEGITKSVSQVNIQANTEALIQEDYSPDIVSIYPNVFYIPQKEENSENINPEITGIANPHDKEIRGAGGQLQNEDHPQEGIDNPKNENVAEKHTLPKYEYKYNVGDHKSGDYKFQSEVRDGDAVQGEYSFMSPDGVIRKVVYTVDKDSGFNAVISKIERKAKRESN